VNSLENVGDDPEGMDDDGAVGDLEWAGREGVGREDWR